MTRSVNREWVGGPAVVTGASGPIGAEITRALATAGVDVVLSGRDPDTLHKVAATVPTGGGRTLIRRCDVTDSADLAALRTGIEEDVGPVGTLVIAAGGGGRPVPLTDLSPDAWRATVETNLTSVFLTLREFVPGMIERRDGSVVTISSDAAVTISAASPAYAAAKSAVLTLTRYVAAEAAPYGVRVNAVAPGSIQTPKIEALPPEVQAQLAATHPSGRLGTPVDIAQTTLFLLSNRADWITGEVLTPGARTLH